MKKIFMALILCAVFACNEEAPKTGAATTETAIVIDSTKGTLDSQGSDIDLMKKLISSAEKADWEAVRACFADSAVVWYNQWPIDTTQKGTLVTDVINIEKKDRVNWEGISYGEPIYEVVTTGSGDRYGHVWARYTGRNKKTGKNVDCPLFLSYLIKDGKLQWEWAIYDSKKLE